MLPPNELKVLWRRPENTWQRVPIQLTMGHKYMSGLWILRSRYRKGCVVWQGANLHFSSGRKLILFGENLICNFPPNCSCRILFKLVISLRIQSSNHLLKVTSFIFNYNTIPFTCLKNNNNIFLFSHLRLRTSISVK